MRKSVLILATSMLAWPAAVSAQANSAEDATKFVTTIIDKFNGGDVKAWLSAQADNTLIVDEFGAHAWSGPSSPQRWLDDYAKDSKANGVTGGRVDYGKPLQVRVEGPSAYIVLPTTYRFTAKGIKMAEPSNMTFVMNRYGNSWKITSWTYSATAAAAPDK